MAIAGDVRSDPKTTDVFKYALIFPFVGLAVSNIWLKDCFIAAAAVNLNP